MSVTPFKDKRNSKFPPGFIAGAVVKLRSGGSPMNIANQLSGEPISVNCIWHTDGFHFEERSIPVVCLRLATEAEVAATIECENVVEE